MLHVARNTPAPACLWEPDAQRHWKSLCDVFRSAEEISSQQNFSVNEGILYHPDVFTALTRQFRGKCAFCETQTTTRPYRFRPSMEAGPPEAAWRNDAARRHLYYSWLANSWDNIYAICEKCVPREPTYFPVRGKRCPLPTYEALAELSGAGIARWERPIDEVPVLLDPCRPKDVPHIHLLPVPDGRIIGRTTRGAETIKHFNLNRDELVHRRKDSFDINYFNLLENSFPGRDVLLRDFGEMPHGGAWFIILNHFARLLATKKGENLSPHLIGGFYSKLLSTDTGREQFANLYRSAEENTSVILEENAGERLVRSGRENLTSRATGIIPIGFRIKNFKSIHDLTIDLPRPSGEEYSETQRPTLMIIGENATGKSSILEAISLALALPTERKRVHPGSTDLVLSAKYLGGSEEQASGPSQIEVIYENGMKSLLEFGTTAYFNHPSTDTPFVPVFAYGAFRFFQRVEQPTAKRSPIGNLFSPEHFLSNPEKWLVNLRRKSPSDFDEVIRVIRIVLAVDQKFDVVKVENNQCILKIGGGQNENAPTLTTPLFAVSSGYRSVLGMICDILHGLLRLRTTHQLKSSLRESTAVVLIDEIELHLHPRWKMQIMQALRTALPRVVFIATTHDPLCLRGVDKAEIMVLRRTASTDKEPISRVEVLPEIPPIDLLTVEQMLTSDLFQLYSTQSPEFERDLPNYAPYLERREIPLSPEDKKMKAEADARLAPELRASIKAAMPIGHDEVERLIQEAVVVYLTKRRQETVKNLAELKDTTRNRILEALRKL